MLARVALFTTLAAGMLALPAVQKDHYGPIVSTTAVERTDDPLPCPEGDCYPGLSQADVVAISADNRTDDPLPCPEGDCYPGLSQG